MPYDPVLVKDLMGVGFAPFQATKLGDLFASSGAVDSVAGLTGAILAPNLKSALAITPSDVSGLGTAATHDVPVSGDASVTQCVLGSDSRLGAGGAAYSRIEACGDSITVGYAASPVTSYGWVYQLSADLGGILVSNHGGVSETAAAIVDTQVFALLNPGAANNPLYTLMAGTNDVSQGAGAYEAVFNLNMLAGASWLAISSNYKVFGQSATASNTGTWANDDTYQTGIGLQSTTNGSTLTLPITTYGGPIYLWYRVINGNGGTASVVVDGGEPTLISCSTTPALYFTSTGYSVAAIRIPNIAAGAHNVVITVTSATNASNVVSVLGVGTVPDGTKHYFGSPAVYVAGVLKKYNDENSANTAAYNADVVAITSTLSGDELPVYFVDVRAYVDAVSGMVTDDIHPNNSGHSSIRQAFEAAINPISNPVRTDAVLFNTSAGINAQNPTLTGIYNTAFGWSSQYAITSGLQNVSFGSSSLQSLTSGSNNTAVGHYAGEAITTGQYNTVVGAVALGNATTGNDNCAVGYGALASSTTGAAQVAVGKGALGGCTSGTGNTAVGSSALAGLTAANSSVGIGSSAGATLTGSSCVAIGNSALTAASGNYNIAVGFYAGYSITSGTNNSILGGPVGGTITTGSYNTLLGYGADASDATASYRTVVGAGASGTADNSITLGRSTDLVNIPGLGIYLGTALDAIITRAAAATIQLGAADAASPVAQTLRVQNVIGTTANTAGADWINDGSAGTGSGAGGKQIFQTAPAGGPSKAAAVVTCTSASPGVFSLATHGLAAGQPFVLGGTTAPPPYVLGTTYYVCNDANYGTNAFTGSTSFANALAGTAINTTGTGTSVTLTTGQNSLLQALSLTAPATFTNAASRLQIGMPSLIVGYPLALDLAATDGFLYVPTCAGTPTGTPTTQTGKTPLVYDSSAHILWAYDGGWKQPKTAGGAAVVSWQ